MSLPLQYKWVQKQATNLYIFNHIQAEARILNHKYSVLASCKALTYINSSICSRNFFPHCNTEFHQNQEWTLIKFLLNVDVNLNIFVFSPIYYWQWSARYFQFLFRSSILGSSRHSACVAVCVCVSVWPALCILRRSGALQGRNMKSPT